MREQANQPQPAAIKLEHVSVTGVDVNERALSLKRRITGRKRDPASWEMPILQEVSFKAGPGERVGVIGPNGSGKSSLLKVIAGIYTVASGERKVQGSISPVLEMGVGFDPGLSGRQNIKLALLYNGCLDRFNKDLEQAVVEFTGLGDFIDRPLSIYSTGMRARLAFSVAFFQRADILLLDEVFATGDQYFLEKSRRLLVDNFLSTPISMLVSHNYGLVLALCNRCLALEKGRIVCDGTPAETLAQVAPARQLEAAHQECQAIMTSLDQ